MPARLTRHSKRAAGPQQPAEPGEAAAPSAGHQPLTWKLLLRRAVVGAVTGLVIYQLLPKLTRVLASWPRLATLAPAWMVLALAASSRSCWRSRCARPSRG